MKTQTKNALFLLILLFVTVTVISWQRIEPTSGLVRNDKVGMELQINYADGSHRIERSPWFQHFTVLDVLESGKAIDNIIGRMLVYAEFQDAQTSSFTARVEVRLDQNAYTYTDINATIPLQSGQDYSIEFIAVQSSEILAWTNNVSGLYDLTFIAVQNPFLTVTFSETSVERIFYQETYVNVEIAITTDTAEYNPPPDYPPPDEPPPSTDYIFSDGFESGGFTAWSSVSPWGTPTPTASATTTRSHTGSYSAKIQIAPATSTASAGLYFNDDVSGFAGTDLFSRSYFYFGEMTFPSASCIYLMQITQLSGYIGLATVGVGNQGTGTHWRLTGYDGTSWITQWGDTASLSGWVSLELHYHRDGTGGFIRLYANGLQVCEITNIDTTAYTMERVRFGADRPGNLVYTGNSQLTTLLYLDDCIVNDSTIGP